MADLAQLPYDRVRDIYDKLYQHPAFEGMDLPRFAAYANWLTDSQKFTQGMNDSLLLRANYQVNKALRPLSEPLGELGGAAASVVGLPESVGEMVGSYLPRGLIETGLLFAPGPTPQKGAALLKAGQLAAKGLGGLLSGTETYSQTGSPAAGAFVGLTSLGLPTVVRKAEELGVKALAKPLGYVTETLPETGAQVLRQAPPGFMATVAERGVEAAARNVAFTLAGEAQLQGSTYLASGQFAPYDTEHLAQLTAGQVPFSLLDVAGVLRTPKTGARGTQFEAKAAQIRAKAETAETQAVRQAVDEAQTKVEAAIEPVDKVRETLAAVATTEEKVQMAIENQRVRSLFNRALMSRQSVDIIELSTFMTKEGKKVTRKPLELQVQQQLIDDVVNRGLFELTNEGKLIPKAKTDLEGQVLLDIGVTKTQAPPSVPEPKPSALAPKPSAQVPDVMVGDYLRSSTPGAPWDKVVAVKMHQGKLTPFIDSTTVVKGVPYTNQIPVSDWESRLIPVSEARPRTAEMRIGGLSWVDSVLARTKALREAEQRRSAPTLAAVEAKQSGSDVTNLLSAKEVEQQRQASAVSKSGITVPALGVSEQGGYQWLSRASALVKWLGLKDLHRKMQVEAKEGQGVPTLTGIEASGPKTVPGTSPPEGYKGPVHQVEPAPGPSSRQFIDISQVNNLQSARAWVEEKLDTVARGMQELAPKRTVLRQGQPAKGEKPAVATKVTEGMTYKRKETFSNADLRTVHDELIKQAIGRLQRAGVQATPLDFRNIQLPKLTSITTGGLDRLAQRLHTRQQIANLHRPKKPVPTVEEELPYVPATTLDKAVEVKQISDEQYWALNTIAKPGSALDNVLKEIDTEFGNAIRDLEGEASALGAHELGQRYYQLLVERGRKLNKITQEVAEHKITLEVERMSRFLPPDVAREAGVPRTVEEAVFQTLNEYGDGPIMKAFLDVVENTPLQRMIGPGHFRKGPATEILDELAMFRFYEWAARLVNSKKRFESGQVGAGEGNLWTTYREYINSHTPKGQVVDLSDYNVARTALNDIVTLANVTGSGERKGARRRGTPADELGEEAGRMWFQQGGKEVNATTAFGDRVNEITNDVLNKYDIDELAFIRDEGEESTVGKLTGLNIERTSEPPEHLLPDAVSRYGLLEDFQPEIEAGAFWDKVMLAVDEMEFTPESIKAAKRLRLVANADGTLDHATMAKSGYKVVERLHERLVQRLKATAAVVSDPERFGFTLHFLRGSDGRLTYEVRLAGILGSRREAMWKVVDETGMASEALQRLRDNLTAKADNIYEALYNNKYDTLETLLADKDVFDRAVNIRQRYVNEDIGARKALTMVMRELNEKYEAGLDSTYKNWRNQYLDTVLEMGVAKAYEKQYGPRTAAMMVGEGGKPSKVTASTAERVAAQLHAEADPLQTAVGLRGYFKGEFAKRGLAPAQADMYADIATKIGLAFPRLQNGVIMDLSTPGVAGRYIGIGHQQFLTGLNASAWRAFSPEVRAIAVMHTAAHELSHALYDPANWARLTPEQTSAMQAMNRWAAGLTTQERKMHLTYWMDSVVKPLWRNEQGILTMTARADISSQKPEEFLADLTSLAVLGMASPDKQTRWSVIGDFIKFGAEHDQQIIRGFFVPMLDMMKVLGKHFEVVPALDVTGQELTRIAMNMEKTLATSAEAIDSAFASLQQLELHDRGAYEQALASGYLAESLPTTGTLAKEFQRLAGVPVREADFKLPPVLQGLLSGSRSPVWENAAGVQPNFFERMFMVSAVLQRRHPTLAPIIDLAFRYYGMANDAASKIAKPMMKTRKLLGLVPLGETIDYEATGIKMLLKDHKAREVAAAIAFAKQGDIVSGENIKTFSDAEMFAIMDSMGLRGQKEREAVLAFHRNAEQVAPEQRALILRALPDLLGLHLGQVLMGHDRTMTADVAKQKGQQYANMLWRTMDDDPVVVQQAQAALATLSPDDLKVTQMLLGPLQSLKEFATRTKGQNGYMPEIRSGKWVVAYWEKGSDGKWRPGIQAFDDATQRDAAIEALRTQEAAGKVKSVRGWNKWDRKEAYSGANPALLRVLQDTERGALENVLIQQHYPAADIQALLKDYVPLDASMRAAEQSGTDRFLRRRKIAPGRESINVVEGFLKHVTVLARSLAKLSVTAEMALRLDDPTLRGQEAVQKLAKDHFNSVVNPPASEWTAIKKLNFAYFVGFNVSSIMIEPTQQLITMWPSQTRDTGKFMVGPQYFAKAISKLVQRSRTGSTGDVQLDATLKRLQDEQVLDFGVMQEFYNADELATINLSSLLQGGGTWSPKQWAMSTLNLYTNVARTLYGVAPRFNNIVAATSSFLLARDHGVLQGGKLQKLSPDAAYEYAKVATRSTMGGGGVAARPIGLFSNLGKLHGAVGAAYSLSGYTFLVLSHVARLGLDAIDRRKGLTPVERGAARKALGQTLMTQAALAGAMGIPMTTATIAVLEQLFPGLEANKAVNDFVQTVFDEDEEAGGFFSDTFMRGFPYAVGVDMSSRLQLSNLMGISAYNGFSLKDVIGPTGSIIGNMVKATQEASVGNFSEAVETALPTAFKNVVKLYRDDWAVKDKAGRTLLEPTLPEQILEVIGFRPRRLTAIRAAQQMAERGDEVHRNVNAQFHRQVAKMLLEGDTQGAQQALFQRQQEVEGYQAVTGARSVADAAMEMLYPLDFAREGIRVNAADRQRLAMQGGVRQESELNRLGTKKRLEAVLGVPGAGRVLPSEVRMARLIDYLRQTNPFLSVQEAREQATLLLGGGVRALGPAMSTTPFR